MAINRIHFEGGFPVDLGADLLPQIALAAHATHAEPEVLPEGDYRLTPEWWTRHNLEHNLTVFDTGNGIYRATPRLAGAGVEEGGRFRQGGRILHLPEQTPLVSITGILPDRKTIGIYEAIIFSPGASPRKK